MTRLRPWILAAALLVAVANYMTANAQQMQETVFIAGDRPVNAEQVWQNLQSAVQQGGVAGAAAEVGLSCAGIQQ